MPMLNDPDRQLVKDLEHQLEHQNPAWVRQFKDLKPSRRARGNLLPETAIGLLVLLAILCLLLGATVAAVIFGSAAIVVAYIRDRLWRFLSAPTSWRFRNSGLTDIRSST